MSSTVLFDLLTAVILIVIIVHLYTGWGISNLYKKYLKLLGWLALGGVIFEVIAYVLKDNRVDAGSVWVTICICIYFSFYLIIAVVFARMNAIVFEMYYVIHKLHHLFFMIPACLGIVMLLLTPFTGLIFHIDSNGVYSRGFGFYIYISMALLYFLLGLYWIVKYRNILAKTIYRKMDKIYIVIAVFVVINIFIQDVISIYPSIALGLLALVLENSSMLELIDGRIGLYNRKYLKSNLGIRIRTSDEFYVYVVKIEDNGVFRYLYGEEFESNLMKQIGKFIEKVFKKGVCYQLEDFCFASIVSIHSEFDEEKAINQIRERFAKVWIADMVENKLSAKIGIIKYPNDVKTVEEILENVECICHSEQLDRGICVVRVNDKRFVQYKRKTKIQKLISEKPVFEKFEVYYQPIYSIQQKKIISAEALIRLTDSELGQVSPDEFIPISERNGSIIEIGRFVFEEVCRFISETDLDKYGIEYIEINLSPVQCMQAKLAEQLINIMKKYKVPSKKINLEITETVAAHMMQELQDNMKSLSGEGVRFSMDDYGTGYSNMSSVINLPFHFVKLDKSIVWSAFENRKAYLIMSSSIEMFKKLNLEIVAEGIERKDQLEQAVQMGCDYIQGYYYSHPLSKKDFIKYISQRKVITDSI